MLRIEYLEEGQRIRHYSDEDFMIQQIETGILYEDAVDVVPCRWTYEETDIKIEREDPDGVYEEDEYGLQEM